MPNITSYASTTELRTRVSADGSTGSEGWMQQLLNAAAVLVDASTRGYKPGYEAFAAITVDETRLYDDDTTRGWCNIDDVVSITTVQRSGVTIDPTSYMTAPYNKGQGPYTRVIWARWLVSPMINNFYSAMTPGIGPGQIAITGKFGYCLAANIPSCVKEATLKIAEGWYEGSQMSVVELAQMLVNPQKMMRSDVLVTLLPVMRGLQVS